jgi:hypothetical protein
LAAANSTESFPSLLVIRQVDRHHFSHLRQEQFMSAETKSSDVPETPVAANESKPIAPPEQQQTKLDDSTAIATYANFCRISGTPEELVLDFAMNTQPNGMMPEVLKLNQRVIINFFTAKRLLAALQMAVHRHESAFGVLETDIRKRFAGKGRA